MSKKVRVKAVVKNGRVVGTRQTNRKAGLLNAIVTAVKGKPGGKR